MGEIAPVYQAVGRSGMIAARRSEVNEIVARALGLGVTSFDIADVYGETPGLSETLLGNALGACRDDVVIGSDFGGSLGGLAGPDWGVRGRGRASAERSKAHSSGPGCGTGSKR